MTKSIDITKIENGYVVSWSYPLSTRREYRPKISKTLFKQIQRFFGEDPNV